MPSRKSPPGKIDLGIPNYGYDWPLPFVRGETAATTIGNVEAVRLAVRYNAVINLTRLPSPPTFIMKMKASHMKCGLRMRAVSGQSSD